MVENLIEVAGCIILALLNSSILIPSIALIISFDPIRTLHVVGSGQVKSDFSCIIFGLGRVFWVSIKYFG